MFEISFRISCITFYPKICKTHVCQANSRLNTFERCFLENKTSNEKASFYIPDLLSHVEQSPCQFSIPVQWD